MSKTPSVITTGCGRGLFLDTGLTVVHLGSLLANRRIW
jgi:hypothetical protein